MDSLSIDEIAGREFAERFALNPGQYAWLLGAGASAAAGIATGYQMIQEFRAKLFAQASGVSQREIDLGDPTWQQRIDAQLALDGTLPPRGDSSEYSRAFQALHPSSDARRQYIANQVRKGTPSIGHRVLGSLLSTGKIPCAFTTNFDPLIENGATVAGQLLPADARSNVVTAAIDSADRAERCLRENDWPLVAKLHGDYQSVELKNTDQELAEQDSRMRRVLTQTCQRFGLIVVGYSGRDASVMSALGDVLRNVTAYPGGIYWLCREPDDLLPAVKEFLSNAVTAGVNVQIIRGSTFDELASSLADVVLLPNALVQHIFGSSAPQAVPQVPLTRQAARKTPVLRMSAIPVVQMPAVARRLVLKNPVSTRQAQELAREAGIRAAVASAGTHLAAFGKDEELEAAFKSLGASLGGEVALDPARDSWALGLLYDALVRAVCRGKPLYPRLARRGHVVRVSTPKADADDESQVWRKRQLAQLVDAYGAPLCGKPPKLDGVDYSEGVHLRLDHADGRWWCVFEPATFIDFNVVNEGSDDDESPATWSPLRLDAEDWRRERWARKYNSNWSRIIDAWITILSQADHHGLSPYALASKQGIDARFEFGARTAWSRPAHDHAYFERRRR